MQHSYVAQDNRLRFILASSTAIGALSALIFSYPLIVHKVLLSFIGGILLFVVMRESLPKENEGNPVLFTLGVLLYTLLILAFQ